MSNEDDKNIGKTIIGILCGLWQFFMESAFLRNIVAFLFSIATALVGVLGILYCWENNTNKTSIYWWTLVGYFVLSLILLLIMKRLGVTRVCPGCNENRAVKCSEKKTGNITRGAIRKNSSGNFEQEIREEYIETWECIFGCGYCESEYKWKSHWENVG